MISNLRCDGIYDLRTLRYLKSLGLSKFSFDFSPRSSNFLPEHIFFDKILPETDKSDELFFFFENFDLIMVNRLLHKLESITQNNRKFVFEFNNINTPDFSQLETKFITNFNFDSQIEVTHLKNCIGLSIDYFLIETLYHRKNLHNFVNNFHVRYYDLLRNGLKLICNFHGSDSINYDI